MHISNDAACHGDNKWGMVENRQRSEFGEVSEGGSHKNIFAKIISEGSRVELDQMVEDKEGL